MSIYYDLTKPPKFITKILDRFRKWRLGRYKKKKVRQEKTRWNRDYFIKFKIKIEDSINPQDIGKKSYTIVVPAKAAFFAKRKLVSHIKEKIALEFLECDTMTEEEYDYMESTKEEYINKKEDLN